MDPDAYDEVVLRSALAAQLKLPADRFNLAMRGGSLLITITIEKHGPDLDLASKLQSLDERALSSQLGVALTAYPPTELSLTIIQELECPSGHWCTAGMLIPCDIGFYNQHTNANNQGACVQCPPHSSTRGLNSTRISHCICEVQYYNADRNGSVHCMDCPVGTRCSSSGTTLSTLPLLAGYFRPSRVSAGELQPPGPQHRVVSQPHT